jgi:hypothetical protein
VSRRAPCLRTESVAPVLRMSGLLERDYDAMAVMITGVVPPFADVMKAIGLLEQRLNAGRSAN